jgi:NADPH:quinone reductase-like Zn-dependent oxidoreductase
MRAVVFDHFGGPDVLEVREVETPTPGRGEVAVRVTAAAINHFDLQLRRNEAGFPIPLPFIGGMEAVGVIEEVGDGVEGWSLGDRVLRDVTDSCGVCRYCRSGREWRCAAGAFGINSISGGFAEQLVCSARRLVRLPAEIGDVEAAAVQMSYGTAWRMLHGQAGLQSGDTVLVNSVGSGIGAAAADIAHAAGAFVIGTASCDAKLQQARERGTVDATINYTTTDVGEDVLRITDGVGVDIAFEHVGGEAFGAALTALAMDGRLVTCGWTSGPDVALNLLDVVRQRKQVIGSVNRTLDDLHRCLELVARGTLRPSVAATFQLDDVHAAVELLESRTAFGKVVLAFD